jgi:6,7-dimethyl-8-ribityllumazine synthase
MKTGKVPGRIGIVISRFNEEVTSRLLKSCLATLKSRGVPLSAIDIVWVPGGFEIPWTVQEMALSGSYSVLIALGAILKGATPQNEYISRSVISHLHDIALQTRLPCILGVITPNTYPQAMARTHGGLDRGRESALAALKMLELRRKIRKQSANRRGH